MSKYKHQQAIDELRKEFPDGLWSDADSLAVNRMENIEQFLDEQLSKKEEEIKKNQKRHKLDLRIEKCDGMEGFAAYIVSNRKTNPRVVLLNVYSTFLSAIEEDINEKELIVEHLMHEFGHALQHYFDMELTEELVEKICESYAEKYGINSYEKVHGNVFLDKTQTKK